MNAAKLEMAKQQLRAPFSSVVVFMLPTIEKEVLDSALKIQNPKSVQEWLTRTNYHPERAVVVAVSREYQEVYKPGDILYLDGMRRDRHVPILHNKEVFWRINVGDILCVVVDGIGAELNFEVEETIIKPVN